MDNYCTHGPFAANIYLNDRSYQLVLDWAYDSIYLKYPNNNWIIFTSNKQYYNKTNSFYYDNTSWLNENDIDISNYRSQFNELVDIAYQNKLFFDQRSNQSFELLKKIKLVIN